MFGFMFTSTYGFVFGPGSFLCWIHVLALLRVHVTFMLCTDLYWCRIRCKVGLGFRVGLMLASHLY